MFSSYMVLATGHFCTSHYLNAASYNIFLFTIIFDIKMASGELQWFCCVQKIILLKCQR